MGNFLVLQWIGEIKVLKDMKLKVESYKVIKLKVEPTTKSRKNRIKPQIHRFTKIKSVVISVICGNFFRPF